LNSGTPLRPLFAAKSVPQTLPQSCAGVRFDFLIRKGHRAFLLLGLVALAKLNKSEVDFASNHGTMPCKVVELSRLRLVVWQSRVKKCSAKVRGFANHPAKLTNRSSRMPTAAIFNYTLPAKALVNVSHLAGPASA
jgi:hypothetical protein